MGVPDPFKPTHWDRWDDLYDRNNRLVLMASVGSLKSSWMVLKKAQEILRDPPHCTILHASSTSRLANRMVVQLEAILTSRPIVERFGDLQGEHWTQSEFTVVGHDPLVKTPTVVAVGIGGAIEGDRFRHGHMDDPLDIEDAVSETTRENKKLWYEQTFYNRVNRYDPHHRELVIGSRWHRDDLYRAIGLDEHQQAKHGVAYAAFPAVNDDGTPAFPILYPLDRLQNIQTSISEAAFQMRYQCVATALEGRLLKTSWLRNLFIAPELVPNWNDMDIVQGWDNAFTEQQLVGSSGKRKTDPDYTVCVTLGHWRDPYHEHQDLLYILHIHRVRIAGDHKRHYESLYNMFRPRKVYIEEDGYDTLEWDLRESLVPYEPVKQKRDKVQRIMDLEPLLRAERFRMVSDLKERAAFVDEYQAFPFGKHDDILDALRTAARGYLDDDTGWAGGLGPGGRI